MTYWNGTNIVLETIIKEVGTIVVQGALREIWFPFTTADTLSTTLVPANSRISYCMLRITAAYPAGATITVGNDVSPALIMTTTDNNPLVEGEYVVDLDLFFSGSDKLVKVTVGGTPAWGSGICIVVHNQPES